MMLNLTEASLKTLSTVTIKKKTLIVQTNFETSVGLRRPTLRLHKEIHQKNNSYFSK